MTTSLPIRSIAALATARAVRFVFRRLLRRGASSAPGIAALILDRLLVGRLLRSLPGGVIVVSGSSGKSTTTKMLVAVLREHGMRVVTNASTANLERGLASTLAEAATWRGRLDANIAVLEIDEAVAAKLADSLVPRLSVLTNISLDQLDRFESAQRVATLLGALAEHSDRLVINADDTLLRVIVAEVERPSTSFGVRLPDRAGQLELLGGAVPWRGESHPDSSLDELAEHAAVVTVRGLAVPVRLPAPGVHYAVDAAAALEAAAVTLGTAFDPELATRAFANLTPVFGRGEIVEVRGQLVELLLVQNPASLRLNLAQLAPSPERLMVAVGADVRDGSWLWSVPVDGLDHVSVVSGSRAFEVATRLVYDGVQLDSVVPELDAALEEFLALPAPTVGLKTIVFSADAMRKTRRMLRLDRAGEVAR